MPGWYSRSSERGAHWRRGSQPPRGVLERRGPGRRPTGPARCRQGSGRCTEGVGAQDGGQDHRVGVVGLLAAWSEYPLAVTGDGHRVDRARPLRPAARSAATRRARGASRSRPGPVPRLRSSSPRPASPSARLSPSTDSARPRRLARQKRRSRSATPAMSWCPSAQSMPQKTAMLQPPLPARGPVLARALVRARGDLMARLDGLPSDEPFAIPATPTAPGLRLRAQRLPKIEGPAVRAGSNHNRQPAVPADAQPTRHAGDAVMNGPGGEPAGLPRDLADQMDVRRQRFAGTVQTPLDGRDGPCPSR